jgi:hypothetical protein
MNTMAGQQVVRSRWSHVPLGELFAAAGNAVHRRGEGVLESAHEPEHGSRSGRCVLIFVKSGRWWCRSCGARGDAATYIMRLHGVGYAEAAAWLVERYGEPAQRASGTTRRPLWRRLV